MISVKIDNKSFDLFESFSMDSNLDSVASSFQISLKYKSEDDSVFTPLSFKNIKIFDDQKLILNGTIINHSFQSDAQTNLVVISGYSVAGILEDCTIPYSLYPLESINKSLDEICKKILPYFGIEYIIDSSVSREMNLIFTKSIANPEDSVKEYLSKLAAQRNIIISHTQDGKLLFFRPKANVKSKGLYDKENTIGASLDVNGQSMQSKLYVLRQPTTPKPPKHKKGDPPRPKVKVRGKFYDEIENNLVLDKKRTSVKLMTSGADLDTKQAVDNYLMDQLKNIKLSIEFYNWQDLEIGDLIEYRNDELKLFNPVQLMVTSISKSFDSESNMYEISCNLPEAYAGGNPKNIFQ